MKMKLNEIYEDANLTQAECAKMPHYIDGSLDFYDTSAYQKLYEYYAFEVVEMPYGVAKARTGDPDTWILDTLERINASR